MRPRTIKRWHSKIGTDVIIYELGGLTTYKNTEGIEKEITFPPETINGEYPEIIMTFFHNDDQTHECSFWFANTVPCTVAHRVVYAATDELDNLVKKSSSISDKEIDEIVNTFVEQFFVRRDN